MRNEHNTGVIFAPNNDVVIKDCTVNYETKLHPMYGNAGHRFPRTTQEAFGPGSAIFVATECDDEESQDLANFSTVFAIVVYTLAAIVVGVILWG